MTEGPRRSSPVEGGDRSGRFAGRVALVTGAASGIGAATARGFAAEGATSILVDRDQGTLDGVVDSIAAAGGRARAIAVDVRDGERVEAAIETTVSDLGRLDIVVSNAGIARHGRVEEQAREDLDDLLETHVAALWHLAHACLPVMRAQRTGSIVAVTSVHAFATMPLVSAYAASKSAILGLVRGMALDHGSDGIRVNAVAPGSVDTPMLRASAQRRDRDEPDRMMREWGQRHAIGRIIEAREVAAAILFLASDEASAISGVCLPVDGGLLARLAL